MLKYAVENTRKESVTVDGLGVLLPESVTEFSTEDVDSFKFVRGINLIGSNLPEGVEVSVVVSEGVS